MPVELAEVAASGLAFMIAMSWNNALGYTMKDTMGMHPVLMAVAVTAIVIIVVMAVEYWKSTPATAGQARHGGSQNSNTSGSSTASGTTSGRKRMVHFVTQASS